jgi:competence protein ComEC
VVFFVLVARPQPSVLRAAAMGVVGIVGLSAGGRARGVRALSLAVLVLVLADPWLARSVGFLLSVLATAGILLLAPPWRDALAAWMPRPCADALAVPLAAQVVCTPVVAAISGQVSLVAVLANVVVAPAVGPTTVLGFAGGLLAVGVPAVGHGAGLAAGVFAWWIVAVARVGADFAGAALSWPSGPGAIAGLTGLCVVQLVLLTKVLRHPWPCMVMALVVLGYVVHPPGRVGWPPEGWRMVMCDVGQGDGIVLNAGDGVGVVVDVGPDPHAMDRCLERLELRTIALVLLTHYHADHVDGLDGVLDGRRIGEIEVSPVADPSSRARRVWQLAADAAVPVTVGVAGAERVIGDVRLVTIGPPASFQPGGLADGDDGTVANNASVVVLADIGGLDVLLAGDSELEEQAAIVAAGVDLRADVLKVAHHGSANQDPDFVLATDAAVALVSVGADNDYGHPAGHLLGLLRELGATVYRTDQRGDIAVVDRAGRVDVVPWR